MIKRNCIFLILAFASYVKSYSQSNNIDSVKYQLSRINQFYDSSSYLSFDVDLQYNTDTVLGKFEADRQLASYTLNRNNIYYHVGEMEYMQNDSFAITAYNSEHTLFVTKQVVQKSSNLFPLKEFSDSALTYFFNYYTVTVTDTSDDRVIRFKTDSLNVQYKEVSVFYDPHSFALTRVEMSFMGAPVPDDHPDSIPLTYSITPAAIKKQIIMQFSNYKFVSNGDMFRDDQYIYFDRRRKIYTPVGKYKGYKLVGGNLENTANDYDDIETPASSNNN